jgi:serine/threonine-protein kinase
LALLLVLLLLGGGAAAYLLTRPKQVSVPNVVSDELNTARTVLENDRFGVSVLYVTNARPAQTVIAENPSGGTKVDQGSTVTLTVSSGPGTVTVPPLVGVSITKAKRQLRALGLVPSPIARQPSSVYPAGQVINTYPQAGQAPPIGSNVELIVSSGPAKVSVPDVTGESQSLAKSDLHNAGFQVKTTQQTTNDPTMVGNVISESPAAGTPLVSGSTVTITVGQASMTAKVPFVHGDTVAKATAKLQAAGFTVAQAAQTVSNPSLNGIVLHEMPRAGSTAKKGSTVTIFVGSYPSTSSTSTTTTTST